MAKTVTEARRPDATAGTDTIYRSLFDSFNPDKDGRISPLEVLSRLERSGLQPDDPRIAEALTGLAGADGGSRQISFAQFKALARHNSSLIRRAAEGNLAVPDFAALTADITRKYDELLPVRSGAVAGADPRPVDRWGGTPLSDAEGNGHTEIAALLREHAEDVASLPQRSDKREAAAV